MNGLDLVNLDRAADELEHAGQRELASAIRERWRRVEWNEPLRSADATVHVGMSQ